MRTTKATRERERQLDILIVGPYPPPLGGVSTHVSRLAAVLGEHGVRVGVLNHFGHTDGPPVIGALHRNPLRYWRELRRISAPVVHYHHGRLSTLVAVALARRRGGTYVATIHGQRLAHQLETPVVCWLARWALRRFDELVAVSLEIAQSLERRVGHSRITLLPAYLPADELRGKAPGGAPAEFLRRPGRTLLVSAYRIAAAPDGSGDVYGLDRAVETFLRLAPRHPDLRLGVFIAKAVRGRWARRYIKAQTARVTEHGVADRFALYVGENLTAAFGHDVLYLRPTRSDGDAVSVREAIEAGRQVIASDAVIRPEGAETIAGDDVEAWCEAVERALRHPRGRTRRAASPAHADALLDFYARHLSGPAVIAG